MHSLQTVTEKFEALQEGFDELQRLCFHQLCKRILTELRKFDAEHQEDFEGGKYYTVNDIGPILQSCRKKTLALSPELLLLVADVDPEEDDQDQNEDPKSVIAT